MPDFVDRVQELQLEEAARIVADHDGIARLPGRTHCIEPACGEPIHPARTALDAQRCIECQQALEAQTGRRW